jgi:hypothetical protein
MPPPGLPHFWLVAQHRVWDADFRLARGARGAAARAGDRWVVVIVAGFEWRCQLVTAGYHAAVSNRKEATSWCAAVRWPRVIVTSQKAGGRWPLM